ncbi:hypothetical protein D9757_012515 [Collybiopsis confluens]|uniref:F-box domain-containing protein n=1 Tax=Collybiopsis confluens TaxID=2823264 RepID=A0A8H5D369_9AGAR|nr:hypothetical protein D9757_012515 [Collybiopsis confluens]
MGIPGIIIYRYHGFFFSRNIVYDPEPSGVNIEVDELPWPGDARGFECYVKHQTQHLQEYLDDYKNHGCDSGYDCIAKRPPWNFDGEKMYEIDLDNNVFYVDGEPKFNLKFMPKGKRFVSLAALDEFRSRLPEVPSKYCYMLPVPPSPSPKTLELYREIVVSVSSTDQVLDISSNMTATERLRTKWMEVYLKGARRYFSGSLALGPKRDFAKLRMRLPRIISAACRPLILNPAAPDDLHLSQEKEWTLSVDSGFCVLVSQRLDRKSQLQTAVVKLVRDVWRQTKRLENPPCPVLYGAIISPSQVSIVRVETVKNDEGVEIATVKHTPALQFNRDPSLSARGNTDNTPGLEALARFGHMVRERSLREELVAKNHKLHQLNSSTRFSDIPLEICQLIASHLGPYDLPKIAVLSCSFAEASVGLLLRPYFAPRMPTSCHPTDDCQWYRAEPVTVDYQHSDSDNRPFRNRFVVSNLQESKRMRLDFIAPDFIYQGKADEFYIWDIRQFFATAIGTFVSSASYREDRMAVV